MPIISRYVFLSEKYLAEAKEFFGDANALHRNVYENEMDIAAVEILSGRIEKLIDILRGIL